MKHLIQVLLLSWIFMPGPYSHTRPVQPHVEALPDPREGLQIRIWTQYREPGYIRWENRSYR